MGTGRGTPEDGCSPRVQVDGTNFEAAAFVTGDGARESVALVVVFCTAGVASCFVSCLWGIYFLFLARVCRGSNWGYHGGMTGWMGNSVTGSSRLASRAHVVRQ